MKVSIKLSPKTFLWGAVHPKYKGNIGKGEVDEVPIVLSQADPGPVTIELDNFPDWAQKQILSAIENNVIINTLVEEDKEEAEVTMEKVPEKKRRTFGKKKNGSISTEANPA